MTALFFFIFFFLGGGGVWLGRWGCPFSWPWVLFVFGLFGSLAISRFGFWGGVWVPLAAVPGGCIRVASILRVYRQY